MGRAIDQNKRLDEHERRLKLVEDALEEMVQTRIHHVDLHSDTRNVMAEGVEEEFTPPAGKRKKTTKVEKSNTKAEKSSAEA